MPDTDTTTNAHRNGASASGAVTLRFLVAPSDLDVHGSSVQAGRVLEWIDEAGYACAVGWSGSNCVTAYVGDVHFTRPIGAGSIVEARARIIYTGRTSMHVFVSIETSELRGSSFSEATHCILVFVALDDAGAPRPVRPWVPWSAGDRTIQARAESRIEPRKVIRAKMLELQGIGAGSSPPTVFRFLARPSDANWGGNVYGGKVLRWIDEAAFACASNWTSTSAVAVYSGGIHFFRPIFIGNIVEIAARLIHTTGRSMHISVAVRSSHPSAPQSMEITTQCISVFVNKGQSGHAEPVPQLPMINQRDEALDLAARSLIELRQSMPPIPSTLVRNTH